MLKDIHFLFFILVVAVTGFFFGALAEHGMLLRTSPTIKREEIRATDFIVVDPATPPTKKVTIADVAISGMADAYFRAGVQCAIVAHQNWFDKQVPKSHQIWFFPETEWRKKTMSVWTNINPNDPYIK